MVLNSAGKEAETGKVRDKSSEISGTAKQKRRKSLSLTGTIHAEVSLSFLSSQKRKKDSRAL